MINNESQGSIRNRILTLAIWTKRRAIEAPPTFHSAISRHWTWAGNMSPICATGPLRTGFGVWDERKKALEGVVGNDGALGTSWRVSSRTLDGDIANTKEDSAMPKPSLTAFTRGEVSLGDVILLAIVAKNMLRDVEASYVKNRTRTGSWNIPQYRGPKWWISLGRSSAVDSD